MSDILCISTKAATVISGTVLYGYCRRRRFPPKVRLLTEEEYQTQGIEETRKALDELRRYCRSPDCNAWKTISRLSSPVQWVLPLFTD